MKLKKKIDPATLEKLRAIFNPYLEQFQTDIDSVIRYRRLHDKVYGSGVARALFVILDKDNPEHQELERLTPGMMKLNAGILAHRSDPKASALINLIYA